MKRSAQVALVLMGVTGTTAAGAYMMPPRPECQAAPSAAVAPGAPPAVTGAAPAAAPQPCRRRSWGSWRWSGNSHYYSYDNNSPRSWFPSTRSSPPTSTSIAPTSSGPHSSGPSAPSAPRGGFGTTGHSHGPGS
jgi:hypothetical protein